MLFFKNGLGDRVLVPGGSTNVIQAGGTAPTGSFTTDPGLLAQAYTPPTTRAHPRYTAAQVDAILLEQEARRERRSYWTAPAELIASGVVPMCSPDSVIGTQIYAGKADCYNSAGIGEENFIPGAWSMWGVPFSITDLKDGRITKTFYPTQAQRNAIEGLVIAKSIKNYGGNPRHHPWSVNSDVDGTIEDVLGMAIDHSMRYELANFSLNPISPTYNELTKDSNGFSNWVKRGGYPIDVEFTNATRPIVEAANIQICKSILCNCDGRLACIRENLGGPNGHGWDVYLSIFQTAPWTFTLTLIPHEVSWITEVGEFMAGVVIDLGKMFCGNKDVAKQQIAAAMAEKCITAKNVACTKGTPGCVCSTPPDYINTSVNVSNGIATKFCDEWMKEYTDRPPWTPPTPLNPPRYPTGPIASGIKVPWWAVVVGGLTIGAFLFSRK